MMSGETKGLIFNIEEFAVYDGPGIRTAVFFKGCPLRCVWCHNPEGISNSPETLVNGRISGYEITAGELAAKLSKNIDFYNSSGGGVTVSGGEPLAQIEFLLALLDELKSAGIHTAIETSGFAASENFSRVLELVDLVILDIKHADSAMHKEFTGVDNTPILANLELLKLSDVPFIVRIPLIPDVNDSDENMRATAELLKGVKNLIQVELLPYNKLTGAKYRTLGKPYNPAFNEQVEPSVNQKHFTDNNIRSVTF